MGVFKIIGCIDRPWSVNVGRLLAPSNSRLFGAHKQPFVGTGLASESVSRLLERGTHDELMAYGLTLLLSTAIGF